MEFNSSLGLGGTVPRGITYKLGIVVFLIYSAQSTTFCPTSKFDSPLLLDRPNILCTLPRRRSQSINKVDSPV